MSKTRRPKYRDGRFEDDGAEPVRGAAWEPRQSWADLGWRDEERARDSDRRRNEDRGWFSGRGPGDMDWDASDFADDDATEEVTDEEEEE